MVGSGAGIFFAELADASLDFDEFPVSLLSAKLPAAALTTTAERTAILTLVICRSQSLLHLHFNDSEHANRVCAGYGVSASPSNQESNRPH